MVQLFHKIWNRPMPPLNSRDILPGGIKLIIIFTIFYFAIFRFNAPLDLVIRDIIEFLAVVSSLFASWLIFWGSNQFLSARFNKPNKTTLGTYVISFLFIYSMMILILFCVKAFLLDSGQMKVWAYYWRHFPYACLIFLAYLYRENKKIEISSLLNKANDNIEKAQKHTVAPGKTEQVEEPITIQVDGGYQKIYPSHISHISVDGHYLDIYLVKKDHLECVMIRKSLSQMIDELPSPPFFRTHRSHIANLKHASKIIRTKNSYSISLLNNEGTIPISRSHLETVLSAFEAIS